VEEADEEVSGKLDIIPKILNIVLTTPCLATDWDGSDGEYDGSSEPMDSIAELGDVDAQL
jgi:hypothetical protein